MCLESQSIRCNNFHGQLARACGCAAIAQPDCRQDSMPVATFGSPLSCDETFMLEGLCRRQQSLSLEIGDPQAERLMDGTSQGSVTSHCARSWRRGSFAMVAELHLQHTRSQIPESGAGRAPTAHIYGATAVCGCIAPRLFCIGLCGGKEVLLGVVCPSLSGPRRGSGPRGYLPVDCARQSPKHAPRSLLLSSACCPCRHCGGSRSRPARMRAPSAS